MRCEPANTIIKKFKGLKSLADVTDVKVHTVMRWRMPKDKGGTGGVVPHWHVPAILEAAKARGLDIRPSDFAPVMEGAA
ncbi:MAG: hypothetical protein ACT6U0_09910 [Shinella sp.]|uniref:hypothetical protein n=1 Tax=Shinella sp. TaxID=1870904 RepID=UPI0040355995